MTKERLIDWKELKTRVPFSRMHIHRLEVLGQFPRRVKIGTNRVAWKESLIDEWVESRPVAKLGVA